MNIIDLSHKEDFKRSVLELENLIIKSAIKFDLLIIVLRAGQHLYDNFQTELRAQENLSIKISRPSTKFKKKFNSNIFLYVPKLINNLLRVIESYSREIIFSISSAKTTGVELNLSSVEIKKISICNNILIIDDAIDSGSTISSVISHIIKINSKADIRVGCITQTFKKPLIHADYCLYKRTIVKFPWSLDSKVSESL